MSPKKVQLLFFCGVGLITSHFSYRLFSASWDYFDLKEGARAQIAQWEIVAVKDRFGLKATYGFEAQEKTWQNSFLMGPPYYLNEPAALTALRKKAKESWTAWYNPKNPYQSALEKNFPFSLLFRALICYGVLIYFLYLNKRLVRL